MRSYGCKQNVSFHSWLLAGKVHPSRRRWGCVLPYVGVANLKNLVDLLSMHEGKTGPISVQYPATPAPGHSIGNALRDRRRLQYLQPRGGDCTHDFKSTGALARKTGKPTRALCLGGMHRQKRVQRHTPCCRCTRVGHPNGWVAGKGWRDTRGRQVNCLSPPRSNSSLKRVRTQVHLHT